ncbi:MAG: MBL fold metallo-hydrolase [Polynucleobacter sp. 24-46-87]|nr:MAG: MBL fold metallo-hydrolase [Polynucleobacter sp. 32-46-5]OYY57296.1 MAG: MBL fold metallo-hydrolase [Polynucleobacter sp. 35-46-207]OYZ36492.1 MAG: MBL fold metallo-hydrolase [Polynucleobacter sp. 16-46-70]OZA11323.1 MAG: MBL fold metallo-hydrolase [Polynucleobacter sp. 24-46-87]OZA39218.1 MAG: MBL fold metallo-hydrolase [Polynucleobacter sp. 17-46-58]OZB47771.1 MAG: MBL fold metallo-hydrolase [Polynucleobacter sp. 39-45-136]HQR85088.1 MBL fold metallo-hydrolase [Polynucleobacter sp.]
MSSSPQAVIQHFFDPETWTYTYVVYEDVGSPCAIIDSVLNYDPKSGRTKTKSADEVIAFVQSKQLETTWILETHAHADHLTAAPYLQSQLGGKIVIGDHITNVQTVFKGVFGLDEQFDTHGAQFDHLLKDGESLAFGNLSLKALYVPGHTPACMAYVIGDAIFVGDTLFMPDVGTARCDFPGGNANMLYQSVQKILAYPPETKLYMCHDYPPATRQAQCMSTVGDEKKHNIHVHDGITEEQFVQMRTARDKTLEMPTLILPSIQVNIRAGHFPEPDANGVSYLKIPLNAL